MKHLQLLLVSLFLLVTSSAQLLAQSAYAGLYIGQLYQTVTGGVSVPRAAIGVVNFTIDDSGNVIGNITGTVDAAGTITWNANTLGFTTGSINGSGLMTATAVDNQAAVTVTSEIESQNQAGGFGNGGSVASSFEWRAPTPVGGVMNSVTYGDGKFVAVGEGGVAAWSSNGIDWFSLYIPAGVDLNGIAYGNGKWVVVGDNQTAFYSTDLATWSPTVMGVAFQKINDIAFGDGKFIAAGLTGIYTSTDALAWTTAYSNGFDTFKSVQFDGGLFVVCSDPNGTRAGQILLSSDGSSWTPHSLANGVALKAAYGNGTHAVTFSNAVYTFTQANASDLASHPRGQTADCIGFVNGLFIDEDFYSSSDGATFARTSFIDTDINDFVTGGGRCVGVGSVIVSSINGTSWVVHTQSGSIAPPSPYFNAEISGVHHVDGNSANLRVGPGGLVELDANRDGEFSAEVTDTTENLNAAAAIPSSASGAIIVGDNGTILRYVHDNFTPGSGNWVTAPSGTSADLGSVVTRGVRYIVGGEGGVLLSSTDSGVSWTNDAVSGVTVDLEVGYRFLSGNQGLTGCYAYGANGTILYRANNVSAGWVDISVPDPSKTIVGVAVPQGTNFSLIAVASDGTMFQTLDKVAWTTVPNVIDATVASLDPLAHSAIDVNGTEHLIIFDGATPVGSSFTPEINNSTFTAIAHGNGRFVALGGVTVATSLDGRNWQHSKLLSTGFQNLCFGNGIFFAMGGGAQPILYRSSDGLNWTKIVVNPVLDFTSIAFGNGIFVAAVNNLQRFYYSSDGINWTSGDSYSGKAINDIEFINDRFVGVGTSTYTSLDGVSWTGGTAFTGQMYDVAYHDGLYVAVGSAFDLDLGNGLVFSSTDGLSWSARTPSAPPGGKIDVFQAVRHADGKWIAVGDNNMNDTGAIVIDSADGILWNLDHLSFDGDLNGLVAANGQLIAAGEQGAIFGIAYQDSDSPYFTGQPASSSIINEGGLLNLSATAGGAATLNYQWLLDGEPIADGGRFSGAMSANLTVSPIGIGDAADYTLVAWNDFGSVVSRTATVSVAQRPMITTQPVSQLSAAGGNASFTVVATGDGLNYKWYKDGAVMTGETDATLDLNPVSVTSAGEYYIEVINAAGSVFSRVVNLSVSTGAGGVAVDTTFGANAPSTIKGYNLTAISPNYKCALELPDGKILVGGQLSYLNSSSQTRYGLLRLNADGSLDTTFDPPVLNQSNGFSSVIEDMVMLSDNTILLGGSIGLNGGSRKGLLRINQDGTVVSSYTVSLTSGWLYFIEPDNHGRFLIGGYFTSITDGSNTYTQKCLGRLLANGDIDTTFDTSGLSPLLNWDGPYSGAVLSDDSILIGGDYGFYNTGGYQSTVLKLTNAGALDLVSYAKSDMANGGVADIYVLPGDDVLLGGYGFNPFNGNVINGFAKVSSGGVVDSAFPGFAFTSQEQMNDALVMAGGNILISGKFQDVDGSGVDALMVIDSNGDLDSGQDFEINYSILSTSTRVQRLVPISGNRILAMGTFDSFGGQAAPYIAMLESTGGSAIEALAIIKDPQSVSAAEGDTVNFGVSAVGGGLSFQWYKGVTPLSGETGTSLVLDNVQLANAGIYSVEVTDASGTVTSAEATLSIGSGSTFTDYVNANYPTDRRGLMDDGSGNGIANIYEYAFGITDDDHAKLPAHGIQTSAALGLGGNDEFLTITYRQRSDDSGLSITPKAAINLVDLPTGGANVVQVGSPVADGDVLIYTYRTTFTVAANPMGFMRLEIVVP